MKSVRTRKLKRKKRIAKRKARSLIADNRRPFILTVLSVIVVASFFVQLIIANSMATRGGEINALEQKRLELEHQISLLEEEKSYLQSFSRIRREASLDLGMVYKATSFEYISGPDFAYNE